MLVKIKNKGFTLIEVLIAMTIFAIIASLSSASLKTIINEYNATSVSQKQLLSLQRTLLKITQDFVQITPFSAQNDFGDYNNIFKIKEYDTKVEFITGGWHNYIGNTRSNLQFVSYNLVGNKLMRNSSKTLSNPQDEQIQSIVWLLGVNKLKITLENNAKKTSNIEKANTIVFNMDIDKIGEINYKIPLPSIKYAATSKKL